MYNWYQESKRCYVYLADVPGNDITVPSCRFAFEKSRWFTRGWTLQELIAPSIVEFYSSDQQLLGNKSSLELVIHKITNIPTSALRSSGLHKISPHARIAWSSNRETTRREDKTYSLLGLVGATMPVLYGGGEENTFIRFCIELIHHYPIYSDHTPLALAARSGHVGALRVLLNKGVEIESRQKEGVVALAWAAQEGHEAAIRVLLDKGANIESKDQREYSPLTHAASNGHESAVRVLLDKGADIESKDQWGCTPLVRAAQKGHASVIRILLDRGASIESRNQHGQSALALAAQEGYEAAIRVLLNMGADIESKDRWRCTPLARAAHNGHEDVVRMLVGQGANIECRNRKGHSPQDLAIQNGHDGVVELLRTSNSNVPE